MKKYLILYKRFVVLSAALIFFVVFFRIWFLSASTGFPKPGDSNNQRYSSSSAEHGDVLGTSLVAGVLGNRSFHRTSFITKTVPSYAKSVHSPQGVYDSASNKTFIVYSAGITPNTDPLDPFNYLGYSASDPYIVAYDHNTDNWLGPVRLSITGTESDAHHYPVIEVDNLGFIHVFHTFHGNLTEPTRILHFKSTKKTTEADVLTASWTQEYIPGTSGATYGYAVKDSRGEMYLFFRNKLTDCAYYWHEAEAYIKSSDNGDSWSTPINFIDPGCNSDNWNTIYLKDIYFQESTNKLHLIFQLFNRTNNLWGDQHYIILDMVTDKIYSIVNSDYGQVIRRNQFLENPYIRYFNAGGLSSTNTWTWSDAFVLEGTERVIYHSNLENNVMRLKKTYWNGAIWVSSYPGGSVLANDPFGEILEIHEAEYRSAYGTDLYVKTKWGGTIVPSCALSTGENYQYPLRVFNSSLNWQNTRLFSDHPDWECRGISFFVLIPQPHSEMRAVMVRPMYGSDGNPTSLSYTPPGWSKTYPIGVHYVLGESALMYDGLPPYPAPLCTSIACNSWETMNINNCSLPDWLAVPQPPECFVSGWATVYNKVTDTSNNYMNPVGLEVRYISVGSDEICTDIEASDTRWSAWEDYSQYKYIALAEPSVVKLCVQYRNYCDQESQVCGALINVAPTPTVVQTPTPTRTPTPTSTPTPTTTPTLTATPIPSLPCYGTDSTANLDDILAGIGKYASSIVLAAQDIKNDLKLNVFELATILKFWNQPCLVSD